MGGCVVICASASGGLPAGSFDVSDYWRTAVAVLLAGNPQGR